VCMLLQAFSIAGDENYEVAAVFLVASHLAGALWIKIRLNFFINIVLDQ
jgi:hypothetical protein